MGGWMDGCVCTIRYGKTELLGRGTCKKVEVIGCHPPWLGVEDVPNGGVRGRINSYWFGAPMWTKVSLSRLSASLVKAAW